MIHSRFIRLFAGLNRQELKVFKKFLDSPFFNVREQSRMLYRYLKKTHATWHPIYLKWKGVNTPEQKTKWEEELKKVLGKEGVANKLFPGEAYNDDRMRRIISNCKRHLITYIMEVGPKSDRDEFNENLGLLRYHLHRGEYHLLKSKLEEVRKERRQIRFRDHSFYFYSFQLEESFNDFQIRSGERNYSYSEMLDYLDLFFILYKLRVFCAMLTIGRQTGTNFRFNMLEELSGYIERNNFLDEPLIKIYYLILQMEKGTEQQNKYKELLNLIRIHRQRISPNEIRQIYGFVFNYLEREHRKVGVDMAQEIFQLFRRMVEDKVIYSDGLITQTYFNTCVSVACRVKEYDWVEDFIYANEELIAGENRNEVFDFSLLTLLFHRGEFEEVLRRIDQLTLKTVNIEIKRRVLKIKSSYEVGQSELFYRECENLKRSLQNKKGISEKVLLFYSNFRMLTERLGRCRFDLKPGIESLIQDLETIPTAEKEWLSIKAGTV